MTDDSGRNPDGTFAPGNQVSARSGGGYGAERQAQTGRVSARLMSAALEKLQRIQEGGAGEMHDELAALALSVSDALQVTFSHAVREYTSSEGDKAAHLEKMYSASRHLHTWLATSARLLQWREEHPHSDDALTADDVIAKYREQNADSNS